MIANILIVYKSNISINNEKIKMNGSLLPIKKSLIPLGIGLLFHKVVHDCITNSHITKSAIIV
jgi:hypothetical protein